MVILYPYGYESVLSNDIQDRCVSISNTMNQILHTIHDLLCYCTRDLMKDGSAYNIPYHISEMMSQLADNLGTYLDSLE